MRAHRLECQHAGEPASGCVCVHLLAGHKLSQWQRFTGSGKVFGLVCDECATNAEQLEASLRAVCGRCFQAIEEIRR